VGKVKRVALAARDQLESVLGPFIDAILTSDTSQCVECIGEHLHSKLSVIAQRSSFQEFERTFLQDGGVQSTSNMVDLTSTISDDSDISSICEVEQFYWISKEWFNEIRRYKKLTDPTPTLTLLHCSHGLLAPYMSKFHLISSISLDYLKSLYPNFNPPKKELVPCKECTKACQDTNVQLEKERDRARREQTCLSFLKPLSQLQLSAPPNSFFVLSQGFVESWQRWIKDPATAAHPKTLSLDTLLCSHGRVKYNPLSNLDRSLNKLYLFDSIHWSEFTKFYPSIRKIDSSWEVCDECRGNELFAPTLEIELKIEVGGGSRKRKRAVDVVISVTETVRDAKIAVRCPSSKFIKTRIAVSYFLST
jgi:hypothetical protein